MRRVDGLYQIVREKLSKPEVKKRFRWSLVFVCLIAFFLGVFSAIILQHPRLATTKLHFRSDEKPTFVIQLPSKKLSWARKTLAQTTEEQRNIETEELKNIETEKQRNIETEEQNTEGDKEIRGQGDKDIGSQGNKVEIENGTVAIEIKDNAGNEAEVESKVEQISDNKVQITLNEQQDNTIKPGKYTLQTTIEQNGKTYNLTQDFTWGVLAINTDQSIYTPNQEAFIGMAVLDDSGKIVCDAKVRLKIKNQNLKIDDELSIENGQIKISDQCQVKGVTNLPDYYTTYQVKEAGEYQIELTAETANGTRQIQDRIYVEESSLFEIKREGPTRVYPPATYKMKIIAKANLDFPGPVREYLPESFVVMPQEGLDIKINEGTQILTWNKDFKKDENQTLEYQFTIPNTSPAFYLLGPLEIGPTLDANGQPTQSDHIFREKRQWQIAADAPIAQYTGGLLVYADGTAGTPKYKTFDDTTGFGTEQSATSVGAVAIEWIRVAASPVNDEWIIATRDADDVIKAQVCTGVDGGVSCGATTTITALAGAHGLRNFDVAYEQQSTGDALLVYGNSTLDMLRKIEWTGGSWQSDAQITTTRTGGTVEWVELTSRNGSDQIGIAYSDDADDVSAYRWDGTAVADEATAAVTLVAVTANVRKFDVAFEHNSGDMYVAALYTTGGAVAYGTLSGTTWVVPTTNATPDMTTVFLDLPEQARSSPGDDDLAISTHGGLAASNTTEGYGWTGSAISDSTTGDDVGAAWAANYQLSAVSYFNATYYGVCVISSTVSGADDIEWWTMSSATAITDQTVNTRTRGAARFIDLFDYPNSDKTLLLTADANSDLWADTWAGATGGTAWTDLNGVTPLEDSLASATTDVVDFAFRLAPVISTITVSGGCFTDAGEGTPCTDDAGDSIKVAVNGVLDSGSDGTVDGAWTFTIPQPASGAILTFFRDGAPTAAEKATTVVKYDGDGGDVTLVKMYQSMLVIGADSGSTNSDQTIINSDLDTTTTGYEYSDDAVGNDPIYGIDTGVLTVDQGANLTETLYIISGDTFRPDSGGGDTVTTHHLYFEGTYTTDNNATNVAGNWTNAGTFTATTGSVVFNGTAASQTIVSNAVSFYAVTFNNSFVADPNIQYTGALTIGNSTTLSSTTRIASTNNTAITFSGTINGANILTINGGTSSSTFGGIIGGSTPIQTLAVTASTAINLNGGAITLAANYGATFTGPVSLGAGTTINVSGTAHTVSFTSTINGANTLTIAGGANTTATFGGVIGGVTPIQTLAVTATTAINLNGGAITLAANYGATFTGPVVLGAGTTINVSGTAHTVNFTSTINGANTLTISGGAATTATFGGVIGGTTPIRTLAVTATTAINLNGGAITLEANYGGTFTGPVSLGAGTTINVSGTAHTVNFTSTINGANTLTISGGAATTATFGGIIGGSTPIRTLAVTATTAINLNGGAITLEANYGATFTGPVSLGAGTTINVSGTAHTVNFTSTINGANTLTIAGGANTTATFGGVIGGVTPITSLSVTASTAININTTGITTRDIASNNVSFTGAVTLGGNLTITTDNTTNDGGVTFSSTINSADATDRALSIAAGTLTTADVSISGAIGTTFDLASITISGNDVTVANIGAGSAGVTGATSITSNDTGGDTGILTLNGTVYKTNAATYVGGATGGISITGASAAFTTDVDNITFTNTATLGDISAVTVTTAGSGAGVGDITFGTIRGNSDEDITLNASSANVTVGLIGDETANEINTLAITGATITLNGDIYTSDLAGNTVTLTGAVALGAGVSINTDETTNDGAITINGTGTINSTDATDRALTLASGSADISVSGAMGATFDLASVTIGGNDITLANIGGGASGVTGATAITGDTNGTIILTGTIYNTAGTQAYNAGGATRTITLNDNTAFTTTDDTIGFTGLVNSQAAENNAVTLNAGTAQVTFNNNVGASQSIGLLTKQGSGDLLFGTSTLTSTGLTLSAGTINNAATDSGVWDVNGTLTITSGTLKSTTNNLSVSGNWSNAGAFTANGGTVILDGAGASTQEISGDNTFYNLTAQAASARTLKFESVKTQAITNTLDMDGAAGQLITLTTITGTTQWKINPTNATTVTYVDVNYSNNLGASLCAAYSTSTNDNNTAWSVTGGASCNTAPNNPSALAQKKTDDTVIAQAGWTNETSVKFTATASDPDSSDTLYLCVEKDIIGTVFSNTEDSCGTGVSYTGTPVTVTVTIASQTDNTEYHWQARVKDAASAYSSWVSYGTNTDPNDRDYGIDTTAPAGGSVVDGTDATDDDYNDGSLSSLSAYWTGTEPNSGVSGLQKYQYAIGTTQGGTDTKTWTDNGTATTVTSTGLTLRTSQMYYFSVRAVDNANNTQSPPIYTNGQYVMPTLSFSISTTTITFANLNNINNYQDTENMTVTTSTNGYNGYQVKAYETQLMTSIPYPAVTLPNFQGGSWAAPGSWPAAQCTDTVDCGFGYTSGDDNVEGSNRFAAAGGFGTKYAPFSATPSGDTIADNTGPVSGTPISNESFNITAGVAAATVQAASEYRSYVIFTCTANY